MLVMLRVSKMLSVSKSGGLTFTEQLPAVLGPVLFLHLNPLFIKLSSAQS